MYFFEGGMVKKSAFDKTIVPKVVWTCKIDSNCYCSMYSYHLIYNMVSFGVGFNNEEQGISSKTAHQERI